MGRKKSNPSNKSNKRTQIILSQASKHWSWFWEFGMDWMLWMCLGVLDFALAMNVEFRKLGCHWRRWLGVFIASNHFLVVGCFCWWWAHRTVRCCNGHILFSIRCVPRQHARWGLERTIVGALCPVVALDSSVPHRTPVCYDFSALSSAAHCPPLFTFGRRPLVLGYCLLRVKPKIHIRKNNKINKERKK
jgi:hypothetical protein